MKFFAKKDLCFWSIILIWGVGGLLMLGFLPAIWSKKIDMDSLAYIFVLPPVLTAVIGLWHVKALLEPPKEKAKWMAAILGTSILLPIIGHVFFDYKVLVYLAIGGLLPILTFGFAFPGILVFAFAIYIWNSFKYPPTKKWQTPLIFIICSGLWELSLLTGLVVGNS